MNFSERIWKNTEQLAYRIEEHIKDLVSLGKMPDAIKKELMNDFDVGLYEADRLVRTEAMFTMNQGHLMAYQNAGVTQYQFLAAIDERTSTICREHNGKTYFLLSAVAGENLPPLHPNCRSTIIPVINIRLNKSKGL